MFGERRVRINVNSMGLRESEVLLVILRVPEVSIERSSGSVFLSSATSSLLKSPSKRFVQEGEHPIEKAGAAPGSLPRMKIEARDSTSLLAKAISTETELSETGQRMRQGSIGVWKVISPWIAGVGYTSFMPPPLWPSGVLHHQLILECGQCLDPVLLGPVLPVSSSMGELSLIDELREFGILTMYNMDVWHEVGNRVLFALCLGFGLVSLSSHMYPSSNCLIDAFVVTLVNLLSMLLVTSFYFCVLGFWATVITHRCSEK
ncbi:orphan sodium- and chloride-dependent neurotransmitter transporter NTT5 isoform X1 [Prionailurus iriomotensis]